jgi:hypothetical protein
MFCYFCTRTARHPHDSSFSLVYSSQIIPPANDSLKRARTIHTLQSPIHDERIHFVSEYTSDRNSQAGGHFQSNSSHDLITNSAISEEMTHTPTNIPDQSPNASENHRVQTVFTVTNISTDSDYASNSAPPAYDSLPTRISGVNSS